MRGSEFDTTVIDPWNDLTLDLASKGGREDLFLADALKTVRNSSRTNDQHRHRHPAHPRRPLRNIAYRGQANGTRPPRNHTNGRAGKRGIVRAFTNACWCA